MYLCKPFNRLPMRSHWLMICGVDRRQFNPAPFMFRTRSNRISSYGIGPIQIVHQW